MRALVVEDSASMVSVLRRALAESGYAVDAVGTGADAVAAVSAGAYEVILLDIMLPDMDGFETCAELREAGCTTPTLMLTALDEVGDRVRGLDAGADDYLTKPFSLEELLARLRALARRGPIEHPVSLRVGDLVLDPARHSVARQGVRIDLREKEFAVLEYLMRRVGTVVTREALSEAVWGKPYHRGGKWVDVQVHFLRQKIDVPFGRNSVESVRGLGYRLSV
jgi:two-component system, OmpR family, response regulator